MARTFLVLSGWVRDEYYFKKLTSAAPKNTNFLFLTQKHIKNAESIKDFLDSKKIKKVDIIGQSTGGARAIEFAAKFNEMIDKLYLVDSEGIYGNEKAAKMLFNLFRLQFHHGLKKIKANTRATLFFLKNPVHSISTAKYGHYVDLQSEMQQIKCPTIIIWGEKDRVTPLWQGEMISKLIPNSKLVVIPNMDHDWIIHSGERFWESI